MYGSYMILNEDADTILPGRAGTERSIDGSLLSLFFCFFLLLLFSSGGLFVLFATNNQQSRRVY
jgi:hypothetical protein